MNLASWIILAIVVAVLALAVKTTFFGGKRTHDGHSLDAANGNDKRAGDVQAASEASASEVPPDCPQASLRTSCAGCAGCEGCDGFAARNTLKPTYRPLN